MDRAQARAIALTVAQFIEQLVVKAKQGLDFRFIFWLAQQLAALAPGIALVTATPEGRAMFVGEVVDAYTGDDPTALHFLDADLIAGVSPADMEAFFDGFKPLIEALVLKAGNSAPGTPSDTEPWPNPNPPTR